MYSCQVYKTSNIQFRIKAAMCPIHPEVEMFYDWATGDAICPECGLATRVFEDVAMEVEETDEEVSMVEEMAERIHAPEAIGRQAKEMLARSGIDTDAAAGACLFAACRKAGAPRTFDEIATACGATRNEVIKAFGKIQLKLKLKREELEPWRYVGRFCSRLRLPWRARREAERIAQQLPHLGRSPVAVAAAAILITSNVPIRDLVKVSGVSKASILACCDAIEKL